MQTTKMMEITSLFSIRMKMGRCQLIAPCLSQYLYQSLWRKKVVATSDNPEEDKKLGVLLEQQREERDKVMNSLQDWKAEFSSKNGRMPSRDEMFADPVASVLFKRFSQLNSNL
mmetsp:Transcript_18954/g.41121  ORF Transcript_18954/g.41121 Transcript_18954/m.41121 type:complete len:114 (+) Transcript_18954:990-1331(+)